MPSHLRSGFHFRGQLPHLKREGAIYFVTMRLSDSLPARRIAELKHKRQVILARAFALKRPLTWHEEQQLLAWYCDEVDELLDAGIGACWLRRHDIAELVFRALKFFESQRYDLHLSRADVEWHPAQLEVIHQQTSKQTIEPRR